MNQKYSCNYIKDCLSAYMDCELDSTDSELVKSHLAECSECTQEYKNLQNQSLLLKKYFARTESNLPEINTEDILNKVKAQSQTSCNDIKYDLSAYFDNELSEEDSLKLEQHIVNCDSCKKELDSIKNLSSLIKSSSYKDYSIIPEFKKEINCKYIQGELSAFIDGELENNDMTKIYEHLLNCSACREKYYEYKRLKSAVSCYFDNFERDLSAEELKEVPLFSEKLEQTRNTKAILSIAALFLIAMLTWFPMVQLKNKETNEINIERIKLIRNERPYYVKSDSVFLSSLLESPPANFLSLMYAEE